MRLHLTLAIITALALFLTLRGHRGHRFTFQQVDEMAARRAAVKYVAPTDVLPPQLKKLTPQQDAGIFSKETSRLWRRKGLPFQIDFYPQLNSNPRPHVAPIFHTVDYKGAHLLPYSSTLFNFYNITVNPPQPLVFDPPLPDNLGYAGFYVRYPDMGIGSNPSSLDGFFSAMGSSYFRVLAKEQVYGLSARSLAINPNVFGKDGKQKPEEFPLFAEWWLHEPDPNATAMTMDALLDSPSVAGAYEFVVRPGAVTSVDVHASLYFRAKVEQLGIAPFSSMYLFGENAKNHFGDTVHPEIHDSDGVLMNTGSDEWIWHPLQQQPFLQSYAFADQSPKGFGLIQRDRDIAHYEDLKSLYNVRPSAWVTPHGDWGKGHVQLVQLNSNDFNTDNVVMFWCPDKPVNAGDHLDLNYTIDFYMNDATRPPLAYAKQTLVNCPAPPPPEAAPIPSKPFMGPPSPLHIVSVAYKPGGSTPPGPPPTPNPPPAPGSTPIPTGTVPVQFLVDFMGDGIEDIPATEKIDLELNYGPQGTYLREKSLEKNAYDKSWRATFTIIPLKHFVPTELRCRLLRNNRPISETWSYTWHQ